MRLGAFEANQKLVEVFQYKDKDYGAEMKKRAIAFDAAMALALSVSACAGPAYYDNGYAGADYNPYCDYYSPPWGYPPDYCRYRVWNEPVYYGGVWFNGPIYYRTLGGVNSFWLNGGWRRDEWRGPRPQIDYNRGGNQFWHGEIQRGRQNQPGRDGIRGGGAGAGGISPPATGGQRRPGPDRDQGFTVPGARGPEIRGPAAGSSGAPGRQGETIAPRARGPATGEPAARDGGANLQPHHDRGTPGATPGPVNIVPSQDTVGRGRGSAQSSAEVSSPDGGDRHGSAVGRGRARSGSEVQSPSRPQDSERRPRGDQN